MRHDTEQAVDTGPNSREDELNLERRIHASQYVVQILRVRSLIPLSIAFAWLLGRHFSIGTIFIDDVSDYLRITIYHTPLGYNLSKYSCIFL